jgi:hypothetical protein
MKTILSDISFVDRFKKEIPAMFQSADAFCMQNGKISQHVGSIREDILIGFLIEYYGSDRVIPTDSAYKHTDLFFDGIPIEIKTTLEDRFRNSQFKMNWGSDRNVQVTFVDTYNPSSDLLLIQIKHGGVGTVMYIPTIVQKDILSELGPNSYFKMPNEGTNSKGVPLSNKVLDKFLSNDLCIKIHLDWFDRPSEMKSIDRYNLLKSIA